MLPEPIRSEDLFDLDPAGQDPPDPGLDTSFGDEHLFDFAHWPQDYEEEEVEQLCFTDPHAPRHRPIPTEHHFLNQGFVRHPQSLSQLRKPVPDLACKLEPWQPPDNYQIPNFTNSTAMHDKEDQSGASSSSQELHPSDLLTYYSLLNEEFNTKVTEVLSGHPTIFGFNLLDSTEKAPRKLKTRKDTPLDNDKVLIPKTRRGRQSKDEDLALQYNLPASANELCMMSHIDLQNLLKRDDLTEDQKEMMKKLRRRGRNKIAARRCRAKRLRSRGFAVTEDDLLDDFDDEDLDGEELSIREEPHRTLANPTKPDESSAGRIRRPTVKLSY